MRSIAILILGLLCFILGAWIANSCNEQNIVSIDPRINSLQLDLKDKEIENNSLRDTIQSIREQESKLEVITRLAQSRATNAEDRFNRQRWVKPKDQAQQIEFLKRDTLLCDSALIAAKVVARSIANELRKSQEENNALDSLTMNLGEQKSILLQTDSLRSEKVKDLNKIIKRNKVRRWLDRLTGAVVIYLLALL